MTGEKIYETDGYWIAETYIKSYYVVTSNQMAAASQIAVKIRPEEVQKIIEHNGDWSVVLSIISSRGFLYASYKEKKMILLINACVRQESRTWKLTEALLSKLSGEVEEVRLDCLDFPIANETFLRKRDALIAAEKWDDPLFDLARQFAAADTVIVAAPYWDLSFPAALKQYFEQINVLGITFRYTPEGTPEPLCRAKKLYYVTTAGGVFVPDEFGFRYVRSLAENFYGIREFEYLKAVGLDVEGADTDQILAETIKKIDVIIAP